MPKASHLCVNHCCRRPRQKNRRKCVRCRTREYRESNPIAYLYNNTKHHARQRGIEFTLTRAEFEKFCQDTQYHVLKGRRPEAASIDRKKSHLGYSLGNIQILSYSDNSSKKDKPDWNPHYSADDNPLQT